VFKIGSAALSKRRDGILGQFFKAVNELKTVNEQIEKAKTQSNDKLVFLDEQMSKETFELQELEKQKLANKRTIQKIEDLLK